MTTGLGHRRPPSGDAYHAVPQSPLALSPVEPPESPTESLVLDPEDDENELEETVIAMEVTPAVSWVHFIFGCAALLPWNGVSSWNIRSSATPTS